MDLQNKFIAALLLFSLAACVTVGIYRNDAIKVQAELDRRLQEEKIDELLDKA